MPSMMPETSTLFTIWKCKKWVLCSWSRSSSFSERIMLHFLCFGLLWHHRMFVSFDVISYCKGNPLFLCMPLPMLTHLPFDIQWPVDLFPTKLHRSSAGDLRTFSIHSRTHHSMFNDPQTFHLQNSTVPLPVICGLFQTSAHSRFCFMYLTCSLWSRPYFPMSVTLYISPCLQADPHPFLFGSPAGMHLYSLFISNKLIFGSPAVWVIPDHL